MNTKPTIMWTIILILSAIFVFSSIAKIFGFPSQLNDEFARWNLSDWQIVIGFILLVSTILFLFPVTFKLGVLLLSSYWGGAIATHLSHDETPLTIVPIIFLVLIWISYYLRNPNMFIR